MDDGDFTASRSFNLKRFTSRTDGSRKTTTHDVNSVKTQDSRLTDTNIGTQVSDIKCTLVLCMEGLGSQDRDSLAASASASA